MYFDYEAYKASCFKSPMMFVLLFSILIVAEILYSIILAIKKKLVRKDVVSLCIGVLAWGLIVCINAGVLLYGGIYLYQEE